MMAIPSALCFVRAIGILVSSAAVAFGLAWIIIWCIEHFRVPEFFWNRPRLTRIVDTVCNAICTLILSAAVLVLIWGIAEQLCG